MKDPAFLFYSQDFLVGTLTMSFEDKGKYITILAYMHQQGRLDEQTISLLVGSISDNLRLKFSVDENGLLFNKKLESEIEKRVKFSESRRNNGLQGGRPKKELEEEKTTSKPLGLASANLVENENVNENKDAIILNEWAKSFFDLKFLNKKSIETFDKLLRIDKYSIDQIKNVIKFAREDSFWTENFLTPNKLREKNKEGVKYIDVFLAKVKPQQTTQAKYPLVR